MDRSPPSPVALSVRCGGLIAIAGAGCSVAIVVTLHALRSDYDPAKQLISELAVGRHRWSMLLAFSCLAISLFGLQLGLAPKKNGLALRVILTGAGLCFFGAGVLPLGMAPLAHIALVAAAFVLVVFAMYLFSSLDGFSADPVSKLVSGTAMSGVAVSVALSQAILPVGVGQRLAAAFLLMWIVFTGWKRTRPNLGPHDRRAA